MNSRVTKFSPGPIIFNSRDDVHSTQRSCHAGTSGRFAIVHLAEFTQHFEIILSSGRVAEVFRCSDCVPAFDELFIFCLLAEHR